MLGNEPFSELLNEQWSYQEIRPKKKRLFYIMLDRSFSLNHPRTGSWMFCQGWMVDPYHPGVVYWKILNLYRKFQFIGNFSVTQ